MNGQDEGLDMGTCPQFFVYKVDEQVLKLCRGALCMQHTFSRRGHDQCIILFNQVMESGTPQSCLERLALQCFLTVCSTDSDIQVPPGRCCQAQVIATPRLGCAHKPVRNHNLTAVSHHASSHLAGKACALQTDCLQYMTMSALWTMHNISVLKQPAVHTSP